MKRAAWLTAAMLIAIAGYAPRGLPALGPAHAATDPDWDELARMEEAGAAAFNRAGDTELRRSQRNAAIVEAYGLLKRTYKILDAHCDANPDQVEALDQRMVNINMMVFWLKKDAPVGIMAEMHAAARGGAPTGTGAAPGSRDGAGASGGASGGEGESGSGIGGSSHRDDPPAPRPPHPRPPAPRPEPPPGEPPGEPGDVPAAAAPPVAPVAPAVPASAERSPLERAREHERTKPSDLAGAVELWLDVLVTTEDSSDPAYAEALGRVSELSARLKDFYRERRNEDPDAVKRDDQGEREASIAERLSGGLGSDVPGERRSAADQLASLGWSPAALSIQSALRRESDAGVRDAMFLALVRIGGSRTCETLVRFAKERDAELALGAVRSLAALARKGPVEARYAGASLGVFVASSKSDTAPEAALEVLKTMSAEGVPGLVAGIDTSDRDLERAIVVAMGAARDGRSGPALANRLDESVDEELRRSVMDALRSIGTPAVPALVEALKKKKTRRYAAIALYDITSQPFGEDAKAWVKWWRENGGE